MPSRSSRSRSAENPGFLKRTLAVCYRGVNDVLHHLEMRLPAAEGVLVAHPPVFVLGAPRSGTTLLYQLVCRAFEVGYLSNAHCQLYGAPSLAHSALAAWFDFSGTDRFESSFGDTPRAESPSECGDFWYRFFPRAYEAASRRPEIGEKERAALAVAVARLTDCFGRPVVFKNVMNVLRLKAITRAFSTSRFLVVERELLANAHSLLYARQRNLGCYDRWWSLPVPGFQELSSEPAERQVIAQIEGTQEVIQDGEEDAGPGRFLRVPYEGICRDPEGTVRDVGRFLSETGGAQRRTDIDLPGAFSVSGPRRTGVRIDEDVYRRLEQAVSSGRSRPGEPMQPE